MAALRGRGDSVEILLENGANINKKDVKNTSFGKTDYWIEK
jgi:hypothetical protein